MADRVGMRGYRLQDHILGDVEIRVYEDGRVWLCVGPRDLAWNPDGSFSGSGYDIMKAKETPWPPK